MTLIFPKNVIFIVTYFGPKSLLGERLAKVANYKVLKPRTSVLQKKILSKVIFGRDKSKKKITICFEKSRSFWL